MEKLLTPEEVAEVLRVSLGTVRWMRHTNTGPKGFLIGRRLVYKESSVRDYIAEQERKAN